jgi:hypothetical protein
VPKAAVSEPCSHDANGQMEAKLNVNKSDKVFEQKHVDKICYRSAGYLKRFVGTDKSGME